MTIFGNMAGSLQVKANWNQDDPAKADYIDGKAALRQEILAAAQGAKDYADSLRLLKTVTLPAGGWSAAAPYTQTVAVEGILATDTPHYGVVYSSAAATALAEKEAFSLLDDLDTANGSVTFTCFEEKPEVNLTVQMEVNR